MKRLYRFERAKFCALPKKPQHKKCAELLEHILEGHPELLAHYNELTSWLSFPKISSSRKELLDRLAWHFSLSGTSRKEYSLHVSTHDKEEGQAFLPINIYLDRLRSSHNIGSILRTIEAFRLGKAIFSDAMAAPTHPQVQKSSMGAASWVTCEHLPIDECPRPIVALETIPEAQGYYDFCFPKEFTLALGNEEYGLSDKVLQAADFFIQIPLYGRKNSLNVACAFAIVAGEIAKQLR